MTGKAPLLDPRHAADVAGEVGDALRALEFTDGSGAGAARWVGRRGGFGWALTQLFGHLSELVINRLNLLPENTCWRSSTRRASSFCLHSPRTPRASSTSGRMRRR